MPEKVLLIHGIGMRDEAKVGRYAQALSVQVGDAYELVPIYWGDLGGDHSYLHKIISRYPDRSENFGKMVQDAVSRPLARGTNKARAWVEGLQGNKTRSAARREVSRQYNRQARERVSGYIGDKFQDARLWLTQQTMPFIADAIVYQSPNFQQKIHDRIREVIDRELGENAGRAGSDGYPVKVIAHSLGGVVAFDMAVRNHDALHMDAFITLGSQPALFHLLDPREGVATFEDQPVVLPESIGRWTNIYDDYDVLAFSTREVFTLHDGTVPEELSVRCTRSRIKGGVFMKSHLGYFENQETGAIVKRVLEAGKP